MALWRGWLPSVIGVIPYVGLNFATYETSKEIVLRHYGASPPTCHRAVAAGPTAALCDSRPPLAGGLVVTTAAA